MTGKQFVEYLVESGLFRETMPCWLIDRPITCNRIPSHIKYNFPKNFSYDIKCKYHGDGIWVDFYFATNNLYASENLKELDIPKLIQIMSKFLSDHEEFIKWRSEMFVQYRDYKLCELNI